MCAFCLVAMYAGEFAAAPAEALASAFPPWQSVHPSWTVFVGCMVGSSIGEWQLTQPADFRSASSRDCPRTAASFSCGTLNFALTPTVKQTIAATTNAARRKSSSRLPLPSFRAKRGVSLRCTPRAIERDFTSQTRFGMTTLFSYRRSSEC